MLSFKAKKAKLAEASTDTPQPAWECEGHTGERAFLGAHWLCPGEEARYGALHELFEN